MFLAGAFLSLSGKTQIKSTSPFWNLAPHSGFFCFSPALVAISKPDTVTISRRKRADLEDISGILSHRSYFGTLGENFRIKYGNFMPVKIHCNKR